MSDSSSDFGFEEQGAYYERLPQRVTEQLQELSHLKEVLRKYRRETALGIIERTLSQCKKPQVYQVHLLCNSIYRATGQESNEALRSFVSRAKDSWLKANKATFEVEEGYKGYLTPAGSLVVWNEAEQ